MTTHPTNPTAYACGPRLPGLPETSDKDALEAIARVIWDGRSLLPSLERVAAKEAKAKKKS